MLYIIALANGSVNRIYSFQIVSADENRVLLTNEIFVHIPKCGNSKSFLGKF